MKAEAADAHIRLGGHQHRHVCLNPLPIHLHTVGRAQVDDFDVVALEAHNGVGQRDEGSLERELVERVSAHPDG